MSAPLVDEIRCLTLNLLAAAENNDRKGEAKAYQALAALCEENAGSEADHPLQWEALGDFAAKPEQAVSAYEQGLRRAEAGGLEEYIASLNLALAEVCAELGELDRARRHGEIAESLAEKLGDSQFTQATGELLAQLKNG